jgi:diguanylate cyclase (GGDEF)-like protein
MGNIHRAIASLPDGLMEAALDCTPVGFVVLDSNCVTQHVNRRATKLLGLTRAGRKKSFERFLADCRGLDASARRSLAGALGESASADPKEMILSLGAADERRTVAVDIRPAAHLGWVVSLEDVTQTRQTQDFLLEHVSSDPVTGLWNRQHFMLMLQDLLSAPDALQIGPAIMLVGLHRFKQINDALGTFAGDMVLRMVGDRLAASLRAEDMLARSAGNEFAIALSRPEGRTATAARAAGLLEKLSHAYVVDGQQISIEAKIGVAQAPADGCTAEALLANAGIALRDVDTASPHRIRFFDTELTARVQRRRGLEADLRLALPRGEFVLHYQAQVDVHRDCVTGLEALIRWHSPSRGMVAPAEFIPLAEETGLIRDIGDWVLREACREAAGWPDEVTVAVNASPLQFEAGDYADAVADALASTRLPARRLEIEITESLLLRDTGTVMATLAALHDQGVRLVLDDFGTGYASLSQLSRFRFDKIKIDRSFVSPPDASAENHAIVRSIAALAQSLGIPSTAEGVETQVQLDQIKLDGCTCVQGYYLSRPVPASAVPDVLARLHQPPPRVAA